MLDNIRLREVREDRRRKRRRRKKNEDICCNNRCKAVAEPRSGNPRIPMRFRKKSAEPPLPSPPHIHLTVNATLAWITKSRSRNDGARTVLKPDNLIRHLMTRTVKYVEGSARPGEAEDVFKCVDTDLNSNIVGRNVVRNHF